MSIFNNYPLVAALFAFVFTQTIKVPVAYLRGRDVPATILISTGGMPSSHSAGVSSLFTAMLLQYSIESPLVAITGVFACLIMYDAMHVRRQSGEQAILLRQLLTEIQSTAENLDLANKEKIHKLSHNLRRISLGHTPAEVLVGAFTGIIVSLVFNKLFYSY